MGTIKLPQSAINFFDENYKEILLSGNLAEGNWNKKVSDWACSYTGAAHSLALNSRINQYNRLRNSKTRLRINQ